MKTILIVDDNESICNILYHYGKEAGYTMLIAHNGQEGLAYFTNYKPDVILLDVMLPDIDGFEVCQCIRKVSRVPILMITAKTADQDPGLWDWISARMIIFSNPFPAKKSWRGFARCCAEPRKIRNKPTLSMAI